VQYNFTCQCKICASCSAVDDVALFHFPDTKFSSSKMGVKHAVKTIKDIPYIYIKLKPHQWCNDQVKPKTMILVFTGSLLTTQH
jgi:hypothetical protein